MKSVILISAGLIICLLNFAYALPEAYLCPAHCQSNSFAAYQKKGVLKGTRYWCGIDNNHAVNFIGKKCSSRENTDCETIDDHCALVELADGTKKCKGFCGACCSAYSGETSCFSDDSPRCTTIVEAARKSKKLK